MVQILFTVFGMGYIYKNARIIHNHGTLLHTTVVWEKVRKAFKSCSLPIELAVSVEELRDMSEHVPWCNEPPSEYLQCHIYRRSVIVRMFGGLVVKDDVYDAEG